METIQLCPPPIRESIALTRSAIEEATQLPPDALALGAEAAEVMGALTDDTELATAVLAKPAVGLPGMTPGETRASGRFPRGGNCTGAGAPGRARDCPGTGPRPKDSTPARRRRSGRCCSR